jgi:predicted MFS family arabinose efflux permease
MLLTFYTHWTNSFKGIPRAVWLLSFVNFINRCGGMVLIFLSVYLTKHLGFSIVEAGYVMTMFGIGALVGTWIGGRLTDKVGYYPVQLLSLLLNGLLLLSMLLVHNFWPMCLAVFSVSVISESFRPANQVAMALYTNTTNRTRSISVLRLAYNLGFTIAPALGGIIAGNFGWHWLFWADGLTCIAAAVGLRLLLKPVKKTELEVATEESKDLPKIKPYLDKTFMPFLFCTFLGAMAFMQMLWTVPVYFKDSFGWQEDKIGWIMALNGALVFLIEMPFIFYIEKRRPPFVYVQIGIFLYIVAYSAFLMPVAGVFAAVLYMIFISFGEMLVMPFSGNLAYSIANERANKGGYMAAYGLSYSFANIFAPLLGTQIIATWGFNTLWVVTCGFALLALLGFRRMERNR